MAREMEATLVAFAFDGDGKPRLYILSKDQRDELNVALDDLDIALLAQKTTAYLAEKVRRR